MKQLPDLTVCLATRTQIINRRIAGIYRKHLYPLGVSLSQLNILFTLSTNEKMTQSELGHTLSLERSTVSRDLHRLVDQGWVRKKDKGQSPELSMLAKGRKFVEKVVPHWQKAQEEAAEVLGTAGIYYVDAVMEKLDEGIRRKVG